MKKITLFIFLMICLSAAIATSVSAAGINKGYIQIISNVDGASVYFDDNYQGLTSNGQLMVVVYMAAPVHTFRVEKAGFTTATGTLTMPDAGGMTTSYATLRPLITTTTPASSYGSISVDSSPQGAKIYLNGYYRGTSPFTLGQLTPGSYDIEALMNGYRPYTTMVVISADSTTNVYCTLQSLSLSPVSVDVISDPTNAFIYLDSVYQGKTPLTVREVSTGEHKVVLNAPGYYNWNATINIPGDNSTFTVSAKMISLTPTTPTITATASPTLLPTATKAGAGPIVVIGALGITGLIAGIVHRKH